MATKPSEILSMSGMCLAVAKRLGVRFPANQFYYLVKVQKLDDTQFMKAGSYRVFTLDDVDLIEEAARTLRPYKGLSRPASAPSTGKVSISS